MDLRLCRTTSILHRMSLMNSLPALHSLLATVPWIKEFRVVKTTNFRSTVHFVVDGNYSAEDIGALIARTRTALAAGIEPLVVTELAQTPGGPDANPAGGLVAMCGTEVVPGLSELPRTLPEALRRAAQNGQIGAIAHLEADGHAKFQTFAGLLAEAEAVCGGLLRSGFKRGDRAILLPNGSAEALPAFWGCVLAGITPLVAQVPQTLQGVNRGLEQLAHVWRLLDRPILVGGHGLMESARLLSAQLGVESVRCAEIESLRLAPRAAEVWSVAPDETAFYSLTSGSMGVPKCIALTHANIIQRAHGANLACDHSPRDVILNWLPFEHIGSLSDWHLRCVLLGCRMVYASKESVIGRPLRWLDLIDEHRITHTWAPNFAYTLICDRLATLRGRTIPAGVGPVLCRRNVDRRRVGFAEGRRAISGGTGSVWAFRDRNSPRIRHGGVGIGHHVPGRAGRSAAEVPLGAVRLVARTRDPDKSGRRGCKHFR